MACAGGAGGRRTAVPAHPCPGGRWAQRHSPFFQAFLWGRVGPAHLGGPVQNRGAKGQFASMLLRGKSTVLSPRCQPGLWLTLPAANSWDRAQDPPP